MTRENRRRVFMPFLLAVFTASLMLRSSRIPQMHAVDILLIFGTGMCFGVGVVGAVQMLRERNSSAA